MPDKLTPQQRSVNMRAIRSKGMKPEMAVRRLVHRLGYRYRLHKKDLPGKPDLVFSRRQRVIFVHGCFWHQHGVQQCLASRMPKSNIEYWKPKLERNVMRDADVQARLIEMGWKVMVIWECETKNMNELGTRIRSYLDEGSNGKSNLR